MAKLIKTSLDKVKKKKCNLKRFFLNVFKFRILRNLLSKTKLAIPGSRGVTAILVAISLPIITLGINYLIKYTKKSEVDTGHYEIPYVIAKNIAKIFNPGRIWNDQKDYLYSNAAQTYNDVAYSSSQTMKFALDKICKAKISKETFSNVSLLNFYAARNALERRQSPANFIDKGIFAECPPFSNAVYNESTNSVSMDYHSESGSGETVYNISKYKENSKLALSLNSDGTIKIECPELKRVAKVTIPRNDVDIIIAIPTNHASNTTSNDNSAEFGDYSDKSTADSTPIKQIARACQAFLKPFLHTAGVAVGLVPYSGKITLSPRMSYNSMTVKTPMNANPSGGLTYAVQAMFYGSDGQAGGDITLRDDTSYGNYVKWGYGASGNYGCPIMARRGQQQLYRGMALNSGAINYKTLDESLLLDMVTDPNDTNDTNDSNDDYKFMQMNTNPCYLGFCNTLAMTCERDCPTYRANPYFLTELTSDIHGVISDLELFVPFKDKRNKSNFLFLPLVMAGNLFSWGNHPSKLPTSGRIPETDRLKKVRALIIIANAPDNFEPMELTYLGFNNDYSEIPMIESDTILFSEDRGYVEVEKNKIYKGVKGAIQFSTAESAMLDERGLLFRATSENQEMNARISFPNKGLLKIVVERENPATVEVYNDNGVVDNVGTRTFIGSTTLRFRGPQQVHNWADLGTSFEQGYYTTKGPNFGHNTSTKKVKIKFVGCKLNKSTLSNQILRFYGNYNSSETGKSLIGEKMDKGIDYTCPANVSVNGVSSSCIANNESYFRVHGVHLYGRGISNLSKFIMATSEVSRNAIVDKNVTINSVSKDGIKYNSGSSGTKYRVYSGNSGSADVDVFTGDLELENYYYYDTFASQKTRSRSTTQSITVNRTFPSAPTNSPDSTKCCATVYNTVNNVPYKVPTSCPKVQKRVTSTMDSSYVPVPNCSDCYTSYDCNCSESCSSTETATNPITGNKVEACTQKKISCDTCKESGECKQMDYGVGTGSYGCRFYRTSSSDYTPTGCEEIHYGIEYVKTDTVNNSSGCTGVCYNSAVTNSSNWTHSNSSTSMSCSGNTPTTTLNETWKNTQNQDSSSCSYSTSNSDNSSCTYAEISAPSLSYSISTDCGANSKNVTTSEANVGDWSETPTAHKRFYAYYPKNIDGNSNSTEYYICDTSGSSCSSTSCPGSSCSPSIKDTNKTKKYPYRYKLHNFFLVNGDNKSTLYTYSGAYPDYNLTSTISSESDSNLVNNQGIYLLSTGNENEYWVCFCGDADLSLDFTNATEAAITFPNINPIQYQVDLGKGNTITPGSERNDVDTTEVFYIYPDQIKDILDDDGNYFVDLKMNGQPRILSIELTNRPLKAVIESGTNINGEIVNHNSAGGKIAEDTETTIELKLPLRSAYFIKAQPVSFWIDGQGDFRQTAGTVRICSNTKEVYGRIKATVPDEGSGTIILTPNYPIRNYKQSDTGVWIDEVTPNYTYTINTDRKLKSISVPGFVAPKVSFSGSVSDQSYTFCSKEVDDDSTPKLFDWPLNYFSHASSTNQSNFSYKIFEGQAKTVNFELTACKFTEATAENLIMQFSPTVNDFPSVIFSNSFNNNIILSDGSCNSGTKFVEHSAYPVVCGDLDNSEEISCKSGYWEPWFTCSNAGYTASYAISNDSSLIGIKTRTKVDMSEAFNKYGPGTIRIYAYAGAKHLGLTLYAGASNGYYNAEYYDDTSVVLSGQCSSYNQAKAEMEETLENADYFGDNYLNSCFYQVTNPCDLTKDDYLSYSKKDFVKHNYSGTLKFHGIGDVRVYVQPQKVSAGGDYTTEMSESELSGSFGNYKYTFSEPDYLLNLDEENLTKENGSFELLYSTGSIGTITGISAGSSADYSVLTTTSAGEYYYTDVNVENVLVTIPSTITSKVDNNILISSKEGISSVETFTISPYTHSFEDRGDGYYYVKLKCRNVYVFDLKAVSNTIIYYDHPNIIDENLINTRIIDGYDQAQYQRMKLYGNINYDSRPESDLPVVSAIQHLYYNPKDGYSPKAIYPNSEARSALLGEEGDFFIQLWDWKDEVPDVQWKIGSDYRTETSDITVAGSDFGPFRSNYAFSGLHRMFFPYTTYNKDYAGYSRAKQSAQVFIGYTLPINLILANSGYQQTFRVDSDYVKNYTKPNEALEKLAKDACAKLKELETNWNDMSVVPMVFLVKYRTSSKLSLEDCASVYTANNEKELTEKMMEISRFIEECSKTNELSVNVQDM